MEQNFVKEISTDLTVTIRSGMDGARFQLSGVLTEDFDSTELLKLTDQVMQGGAQKIYLDLVHFSPNSRKGLMTWSQYLLKLEELYEVVIERLPLVWHRNLFTQPSALGVKTRIEEVELPYFCPKCKETRLRFVKTSELPRAEKPTPDELEVWTPPRAKCKCGSDLRFDGIRAEFEPLRSRKAA